jgi:microcystin degradation protein MlrC
LFKKGKKMKKIGVGGFLHETNTFSNTPTPLENFLNQSGSYPRLLKGKDIFELAAGRFNISASGFMAEAEHYGFEILPLTWCGAEPSKPLKSADFEYLMNLLEEETRKQIPMDGLYLELHGAMVYGDLQDGEEEILQRMRKIVGDIPIVVSLDLHGNITKRSFELANVMIGYRTYPHVDEFEIGQYCAAAMDYLLAGKPLYRAFRQSPFLMPATTQPTTKEPAQSMYAALEKMEKEPGVVSLTIIEGFNAVDMPDTGPSVFAYAQTQAQADEYADRLLQEILDREPQFTVDMLPPDKAVDKALEMAAKSDKPIILVDVQDNAGGGSPSDTIWLLKALVEKKVKNAALGLIWDPPAATKAFQAGEGARVRIALGGHTIPGQTPYEAEYTVEKLHEGDFLGTGPMVGGRTLNLGKMAQLKLDDIRIVISSDRMQALDQSLFRVVGVEPAEMDILVLKSANHYRADFGPISCGIINVDAPSAIIEDPSKIAYTKLRDGVRLKGLGPVYKRPV